MLGVTWEQLEAVYYIRRNNKVPIGYYTSKFKRIEKFFQDKEFTQANLDAFLLFIEKDFFSRRGKKISGSSYNKYLAILRQVGKMLKVDFMYEYESRERNAVPTEKLTPEECQKLLNVRLPYGNDENYRNFRWTLIIKVLLVTAARINEIASVTHEDFVDDTLFFRETKNGTSHKVFLPHDLAEQVRSLKKSKLHNFVFGDRGKLGKEDVNKEIKARCLKAGITKHITSRSMRTTGITAYLSLYPVHKVAKISNHKTIDTMYKHYYKPEEDEIRDMVDHNPISPVPYTMQDVINDYRKLADKYRQSTFSEAAVKCESYLSTLLK